ncbi:hypothetical protein NKG94_31800 [Micromonospora sp. M12]
MLLNICNPVSSDWGGGPYTPEQLSTWSYTYAPTIADSWRTYTDVGLTDPSPQWAYPWVLRNMDVNAYHPAATGPGHYNDPDYLLPMRPLPGGGYELSLEESKTQLGMWAIMAAPLVIGSDPRGLPQEMISALTNPEIVAVDQDPLVRQGVKVADTGTDAQVWSRVLTGAGKRAVALLNRHDTAQRITVTFADVALGGSVRVRDLWTRTDVDAQPNTRESSRSPARTRSRCRRTGGHARPDRHRPGRRREPRRHRQRQPGPGPGGRHHATAFVRDAQGALAVNTRSGTTWGTGWTSIGGPIGGRILGQPAAYGSAGGRLDVFVRGTDNAAWQRSYLGGTWGPWQSLGGTLTDAPTVAWTSPTQWTLVARGADGKLWSRTPNAGWSGVGAPENRPFYGRPSAVVDDAGVLHVAVRSRTDEVWWSSRTGTTWSAWTNLGGTTSGSPTLLATSGRVYLFALAADNRLWQRNLADGAWGGWFRRGEFATDAFRVRRGRCRCQRQCLAGRPRRGRPGTPDRPLIHGVAGRRVPARHRPALREGARHVPARADLAVAVAEMGGMPCDIGQEVQDRGEPASIMELWCLV